MPKTVPQTVDILDKIRDENPEGEDDDYSSEEEEPKLIPSASSETKGSPKSLKRGAVNDSSGDEKGTDYKRLKHDQIPAGLPKIGTIISKEMVVVKYGFAAKTLPILLDSVVTTIPAFNQETDSNYEQWITTARMAFDGSSLPHQHLLTTDCSESSDQIQRMLGAKLMQTNKLPMFLGHDLDGTYTSDCRVILSNLKTNLESMMVSHDSIEKWQKVCNRLEIGQDSPVPGLGPMNSVHDIASSIQYISRQLAAAHGGTHRGLEESEKIIILARAMGSIAAEHDKSNFKRTKQRSNNDFNGVVQWWAQDFDAVKVTAKVSALKASRAASAAVNAVQQQPRPQQNSRGRGGGKQPSAFGLRPKSILVPVLRSDRRKFYRHLEGLSDFIDRPLKYSEKDEKARGDQFVTEMKKWLALPDNRSLQTTTREDLHNNHYRDPIERTGEQSGNHLEDVEVGNGATGFSWDGP
ncbi:hypothetical protein TrRE_jg3664 [Triparma retinervis]|uniref:Uncharacterized protein n=1 Tax=Triparma retinervis TaxID=2557542 RepID=A0A9W7G5U4_9STRA|nr:hypothetical protein TrRE_jg3664 [Triparma retinervis]